MTKPLPTLKFELCRDGLGVKALTKAWSSGSVRMYIWLSTWKTTSPLVSFKDTNQTRLNYLFESQ
jgi:hypothetical protein